MQEKRKAEKRRLQNIIGSRTITLHASWSYRSESDQHEVVDIRTPTIQVRRSSSHSPSSPNRPWTLFLVLLAFCVLSLDLDRSAAMPVVHGNGLPLRVLRNSLVLPPERPASSPWRGLHLLGILGWAGHASIGRRRDWCWCYDSPGASDEPWCSS